MTTNDTRNGDEWRLARAPLPAREPGDPVAFEPFERLGSERLYDSPWCALRRDHIRTAPGREQDYHVFEVTNAVAVVPFLASGDVVMLWHHRHPSGRSQWELPAGRIHANEAPIDAAARELLEETGFRAGTVIALGSVFPNPALFSNRIHSFVATGCEQVAEIENDANEETTIELVPVEDIDRLLREGMIDHALVMAAFHWWRLRGQPR